MSRYRITNPEPCMWAPSVKRSGLFGRWIALDDSGLELPWGHRWSGPLGSAVHGVSVHAEVTSRPEQESGSSPDGDTHRAAEGAVLADALTERLTEVAYATEFLDVRADILALIERDRRRWLDNIAVCELLAKARAQLAARPSGAADRPRR